MTPEEFKQSFQIKPTTIAGELKLQSMEKENVFFSLEAVAEDVNMNIGDFSLRALADAKQSSHQQKKLEVPISISKETSIINGIYKDVLGEQSGSDKEYIINVYVWIETEEEEKT